MSWYTVKLFVRDKFCSQQTELPAFITCFALTIKYLLLKLEHTDDFLIEFLELRVLTAIYCTKYVQSIIHKKKLCTRTLPNCTTITICVQLVSL